MPLHVIASAAALAGVRGNLVHEIKDCFVISFLAMTIHWIHL